VLDNLIDEANRQFTICNACRYCEGICSVFPAMEMRTAFTSGDVSYLSSLCHDCRACLPACPFTPPHEYAVDIPSLMSMARLQTFEQHARPRVLWKVLTRARTVAGLMVATLLFALLVALATGDPGRLTEAHTGEGSFYDIIAWVWLFAPTMVVSLLVAVAIFAGLFEFVSGTKGGRRRLLSPGAHGRALVDVLGLRNLGGGGGGCHAVSDETTSSSRRILHHLVFYGFASMFAATCAAAFQQEILGMLPPYPLLSVPVVLGTVGGIATTAGTTGFLVMGMRRRGGGELSESRKFDITFTITLLLATVTGLLTLALRSTSLMGPALIVHLGTLWGFFLTLPYSKFVHGAYRYLALVRSHVEARQDREPEIVTRPAADPAIAPSPEAGTLVS
jgi:citrate/tricarballylate utilization protein